LILVASDAASAERFALELPRRLLPLRLPITFNEALRERIRERWIQFCSGSSCARWHLVVQLGIRTMPLLADLQTSGTNHVVPPSVVWKKIGGGRAKHFNLLSAGRRGVCNG
jgi:hypothetical protein